MPRRKKKQQQQRKGKSLTRPGWKQYTKSPSGQKVLRCQAKKSKSKPPKQCGQVAEKGKRVCRLHGARGGRRPKPADPLVYYSVAGGRLKEMLNTARGMSKDQIETADDEIKLLTACISHYIQEKGEELSPKDISRLAWMTSTLVGAKRDNADMKYSGKNTVSIEAIQLSFEWFTQKMIEYLREYPKQLEKFLGEIREFHIDISKLLERRA